jgi:hypothetical protein
MSFLNSRNINYVFIFWRKNLVHAWLKAKYFKDLYVTVISFWLYCTIYNFKRGYSDHSKTGPPNGRAIKFYRINVQFSNIYINHFTIQNPKQISERTNKSIGMLQNPGKIDRISGHGLKSGPFT